MADKKITQLTNITGANLVDADEFVVVDISEDETKAITLGELKEAFDSGSGFVRTTGDTMTGDLTVPNLVTSGNVDGRDVSSDGTKLDGIEAGATADQTAAEIKTAYESNADTNEFSDAEQTKLAGIATGATVDQTPAEIKVAYESNSNTNEFSDAEQTKLAGIATGATAYSNADVDSHVNVSTATASQVLSWTGSDYDWITLPAGTVDLLAANNLSDLDNIATARTNLDVDQAGTAYTKAQADAAFATAAQGALGASALQPDGDGSQLTGISTADGSVSEAKLQVSNAPTDGQLLSAQSGNTGGLTWADAPGSPAGSIIYHAANTPPTGFIKANGASLSTSTYSALFAAIGYTFGGSGSSFNVPDLRGEFLRGWDDSRGVDSSRAFGSAQADAFKSHTHNMFSSADAGSINAIPNSRYPGHLYNQHSTTSVANSGSSGPTGGTETRPRNVALLACIKY
jgi:microcystin-dependent protein